MSKFVMIKSVFHSVKFVPFFAAFLALCFSVSAVAENYAQLVVSGPEKLKVNRCGASTVTYSYLIQLRENGSWDLFDAALGSYERGAGTYQGALTSRKIVATTNAETADTLIERFADYAEGACRSANIDINDVAFVYKIKINKRNSEAKMTSKARLTGFDNQNLIKKKGQYIYSGKGSYSINLLAE